MYRSVSRAAAAAHDINMGGRPSRLTLASASASASALATSWSTPSRPLSQLTMGFEKIEEWKQNKIKQAELNKSSGKTRKPTIFDLKIDTPMRKSTVWNISYAPDEASPQPINTRVLQQQMSDDHRNHNNTEVLQNIHIKADETAVSKKATPKKPKETAKLVIIDAKLILKARLSESIEFCDPTDPDNDMGVDHKAFYQRQVPLFLGGGPFC